MVADVLYNSCLQINFDQNIFIHFIKSVGERQAEASSAVIDDSLAFLCIVEKKKK